MRIVAVAAVVVSAILAAPAGGGGAAAFVVDRTVECALPAGQGYPDPAPVYLNVYATPRQGDRPPSVFVYDRRVGNLGWSVGFQTTGSPERREGAVWINRTECRRSTRRVALTTTGLRGDRSPLGMRHRCEVPGRVLVRLRVEFTRPVTLLPSGEQLVARGTISTGTVVVRTLRGEPIFLGSAQNRPAAARSFVSVGRCVRA